MTTPFDRRAVEYDRWFDAPRGAAIFREECEALLLVKGRGPGRWLEVGVGTGRFASAFSISYGVDPSRNMLSIASSRGIQTQVGVAERLPYRDALFDGVLIAVSLCFVGGLSCAIRECARVLRPAGAFLVGGIPSTSAWGEEYSRKADAGHPIYSQARFLSLEEVVYFVAREGFLLRDAASALLWNPVQTDGPGGHIERGARPDAGFVALRFEHAQHCSVL